MKRPATEPEEQLLSAGAANTDAAADAGCEGAEIETTDPVIPDASPPRASAQRRRGGEGRGGQIDLPRGLAAQPVWRQVVGLAVWPFFELMFNSLVGVVDLALAGRLGEGVSAGAADAIGAAGYVQWLMGLLHMAVATGAGAVIARSIGARKRASANLGLGQALNLAVVWGCFIGVAVWFAAPWIAALFQLQPQPTEFAVTYLRITSLAVPISAVLFVGNACLRAAGDTRSPFFAMVIVNVVNVAVSILATFGPAPLGGHGVAGIALGTAVAWAVGGLVVLILLLRGRGGLRLRLIRLRPDAAMSRRIVKVGLPSLVENSGLWVGNAIIGALVGGLGAAEGVKGMMGAHMIAIRIESMSFLPCLALGTAAATLMGQYLGAGDPTTAARATKLSTAMMAGLMLVTGTIFVLFPEPLVRLLAPADDHLVGLATPLVRICGPIQVAFGTYIVLSKALRGAGDTLGPMLITYLSTFLVRLPAAYLLAFEDCFGISGLGLGWGLSGLWLGLCGELVVRAVLYVGWFRRGRWRQLSV